MSVRTRQAVNGMRARTGPDESRSRLAFIGIGTNPAGICGITMSDLKHQKAEGGRKKSRSGLTLVALLIAMALNLLIILAAGVLLVSGNRAWQNAYNVGAGETRQDALAVGGAFTHNG